MLARACERSLREELARSLRDAVSNPLGTEKEDASHYHPRCCGGYVIFRRHLRRFVAPAALHVSAQQRRRMIEKSVLLGISEKQFGEDKEAADGLTCVGLLDTRLSVNRRPNRVVKVFFSPERKKRLVDGQE